jgi:hypothetical protein
MLRAIGLWVMAGLKTHWVADDGLLGKRPLRAVTELQSYGGLVMGCGQMPPVERTHLSNIIHHLPNLN